MKNINADKNFALEMEKQIFIMTRVKITEKKIQ